MEVNYDLPKPPMSTVSLEELDVWVIAVIFLQSLLIAWFLFLIAGTENKAMPLFRIMMG